MVKELTLEDQLHRVNLLKCSNTTIVFLLVLVLLILVTFTQLIIQTRIVMMEIQKNQEQALAVHIIRILLQQVFRLVPRLVNQTEVEQVTVVRIDLVI